MEEPGMSRNMRSISFATVNLYNLQMPGAAMYPRSRLYTEEEFEAKIDWLAQAIVELDADVIAFQELWSREALEAVFARAGAAGEYALAFIKEGGWGGVAVAAAVRAPWEILGVTRHKDFPEGFRIRKRNRTMADIQADPPAADRNVDPDEDPEFIPSHEDDGIAVVIGQFARSVLQVSVGHSRARRPSVPPIEVFCTHLKSKLATPLDDQEWRNPAIRPHALALGQAISTVRRIAEAAALRIVVDGSLRDTDVPGVVLGDLNDGQFSNALAVLSGQPSFRVAVTSRAGARSDRGLQQLRSLGDVYYTHEFKNVLEVIDHVLVSEQFYDWSQKRLWGFREMRVINDHLDAIDRTRSDHGLVRAAFDWAPA
jgi:endonuclease/exonuclease/phosphatase family metal-dependent hydrolase